MCSYLHITVRVGRNVCAYTVLVALEPHRGTDLAKKQNDIVARGNHVAGGKLSTRGWEPRGGAVCSVMYACSNDKSKLGAQVVSYMFLVFSFSFC